MGLADLSKDRCAPSPSLSHDAALRFGRLQAAQEAQFSDLGAESISAVPLHPGRCHLWGEEVHSDENFFAVLAHLGRSGYTWFTRSRAGSALRSSGTCNYSAIASSC